MSAPTKLRRRTGDKERRERKNTIRQIRRCCYCCCCCSCHTHTEPRTAQRNTNLPNAYACMSENMVGRFGWCFCFESVALFRRLRERHGTGTAHTHYGDRYQISVISEFDRFALFDSVVHCVTVFLFLLSRWCLLFTLDARIPQKKKFCLFHLIFVWIFLAGLGLGRHTWICRRMFSKCCSVYARLLNIRWCVTASAVVFTLTHNAFPFPFFSRASSLVRFFFSFSLRRSYL